MIMASTFTGNDVGDPSQGSPLLDQIEATIAGVTANSAYDGMPTYEVVAAYGVDIRVIIPPHLTAVLGADAVHSPWQRDQHILSIATRGRLGWQEETDNGQRALVETAMGQVWLAEQTLPVQRQVALKPIKAGMYDESKAQRFQSERQSLAIMDHPAIARVFDAGSTPQGQPYFVMEYVPGLPITQYCDQKRLRSSDRLELFIQVCEGVQHAYQKAIIHRDLKPANILVVEVDGKPVPRIIDFGLDKAATPQIGSEALHTQLGHFVGTPGYMSPEQADPNVLDIDTRTDVHSQGVVLYVLLSGVQPFEISQRQKQSLDELLRKLREVDPPRPSTKVVVDRASAASIAEERGTQPRQLARLLRGDLDWITMKALDKDRARRYGAASELVVDIRRYLNHEPVDARPASPDLANSNMTMGLALYLMHSPQEALLFERRPDSMYRDEAIHEPDSESNEVDHTVSLIYAGRAEVDLHRPEQARKDFEQARQIMEQLVARSPKHKYFRDTLEEAQSALKALPHDKAPIAVH